MWTEIISRPVAVGSELGRLSSLRARIISGSQQLSKVISRARDKSLGLAENFVLAHLAASRSRENNLLAFRGDSTDLPIRSLES